MKRYSRNRQAIIECLRSTKIHPTADWVYEKLKPEYPNLSLATVYRNLAQLKEDGAIRSVGIVDGRERFDGDTSPHTHVVCTKCGKVTDVFDASLPGEVLEKIKSLSGYGSIGGDPVFHGVCHECSAEFDKSEE